MITYTTQLDTLTADMLQGFFAGWPNPPSQMAHLKVLQSSYLTWVAIDTEANKVVGFVNAISDGIMSAYIPLLEVLPEYQGQGIGKELVTRMLESLKHLYMVDLLCDEHLQQYYSKLGMVQATGMLMRNHDRQSCE